MKRTFVTVAFVWLSAASAFAQVTLKLGEEEIKIVRDRFGVPHVAAATERGLFYGNGYAVAQDRLWQMERYRRDARGEMAELDAKALKRDRDTRTLGHTEAERQARFDALENQYKVAFLGYAEGVTAWMKEAAANGTLPEEFSKQNIKIVPWRATDSIAIGDMMAQRFGSGGGGELRNLRYLGKLEKKFGEETGLKIFNDLFWHNDPASPVTVPPGAAAPRNAPARSSGATNLFSGQNLSEQSLARAEARADLREIRAYAESEGLFSRWGSYAWAVSPGHTSTGNAMLVGGPQMGFSTPQIAHEIHLGGAGLNIIGMGFAGIPGVLIGHNNSLAWTTTSGVTDMEDVFVEKLNPANKYQYWFQGQWRDMEKRTETIRVRDGKEETVEICRTVHGPVIEWDDTQPIAYSLAAAFRNKETETLKAMYGFWRAATLQEFAASAKMIWLTHNFLVATTSGDIGYWHCGRPPLRADGIDPRMPTPGTGEKEWKGVLSVEQIPQSVNPAQGFLYNWNNKPSVDWDNGDRPTWGGIFRVHRIRQLLEAQPKLSFEQVRDITIDIGLNDPTADYLKPHLLKAIKDSGIDDPRLNLAYDLFKSWDNHAIEGSIAKTLFDEWVLALRDLIFADELADVDADVFQQITQPSLLLHVLDGKDASVPVQYDFLNGRSAVQIQIQALEKAAANLAAKRGPAPALWGHFQPNINFRPLPPIPATSRGTYILAVELSKPLLRSVSILPPGQSEDPKSPHYGDQREMAGYWKFKPMLYLPQLIELDQKFFGSGK